MSVNGKPWVFDEAHGRLLQSVVDVASTEPVVVDEVTSNPIFARSVAAATGYVPRSVMATPLFDGGESIGVLEALDRQVDSSRTLADAELHALSASQAAIALQVVIPSQAGVSGLANDEALTGIVTALGRMAGPRREAGRQLLEKHRANALRRRVTAPAADRC